MKRLPARSQNYTASCLNNPDRPSPLSAKTHLITYWLAKGLYLAAFRQQRFMGLSTHFGFQTPSTAASDQKCHGFYASADRKNTNRLLKIRTS